MEITTLSKTSLKIKGKQASIVVDPSKGVKAQADAIVVLDAFSPIDDYKIEGSRLFVKGPGEYEIGGIKISGFRTDGGLTYSFLVDGVEILLLQGAAVEKLKEKARDYHIVVVNAETLCDSSHLAAFSPRVIALYGEKAEEIAKSLGKEDIKVVSRYTTTLEKLPEETEVVALG